MDLQSLPRLTEALVVPFILFTLPRIIGGVLGVIGVLFFGTRIMRLVSRLAIAGARQTGVKPALVDLLAATITGIGWILIAAGILQALSLNELAFAVGGSVSLATLGIATAASGNLGDIIAGVFLASDPDFGNGFTITIRSPQDPNDEITGTIERIDLRKTRLRTTEGKLLIIPNKAIENNVWSVERRPTAPPPAQPPRQRRGFGFDFGRGDQSQQPPNQSGDQSTRPNLPPGLPQ